MRLIRKAVWWLVAAALVAVSLVFAPSAGAEPPPGSGGGAVWSHKTFSTTYEGGTETCTMWLRKPSNPPGGAAAVSAIGGFTCPYQTPSIAASFVLQAEGYPGKETSGPVWNGTCVGHASCWRHRPASHDVAYLIKLSYPARAGLQLAYDSFHVYDPFNECPGAHCLLLSWRTWL